MMSALERSLWTALYDIRNRYAGKVNTDDQFNKMLNECRALNSKYENTDARIPAKWCTQMLLEMFNEEWMLKQGCN